MKFKSNFKITAPSTITNIGCGLNIFGLAISALQDEIIVKPSNHPGVHITSIRNNSAKLPVSSKKNTAGTAAQLVLNHIKREYNLDKSHGLSFELIKSIPIGLGLGSSAASGVAGAIAVNEAFGNPLSKKELLPFIIKGNLMTNTQACAIPAIASITGGLTLVRDENALEYHRMPVPKGLHVVVCHPISKTKKERQVRYNIATSTALINSNLQTANAAALIHGLHTSNFDLISKALKEQITEDLWVNSFSFYKEAKESALLNNAICCSISNYGPTIFALCKSNIDAETVAESIEKVFLNNNRALKVYISKVNQLGASLT
ncbi:MAG: homoserine kinase [Saprospiraceae bacterium]|nr:homoserine kinase [Saprospiraceae bacterium]